jgi:hypothetical protein
MAQKFSAPRVRKYSHALAGAVQGSRTVDDHACNIVSRGSNSLHRWYCVHSAVMRIRGVRVAFSLIVFVFPLRGHGSIFRGQSAQDDVGIAKEDEIYAWFVVKGVVA